MEVFIFCVFAAAVRGMGDASQQQRGQVFSGALLREQSQTGNSVIASLLPVTVGKGEEQGRKERRPSLESEVVRYQQQHRTAKTAALNEVETRHEKSERSSRRADILETSESVPGNVDSQPNWTDQCERPTPKHAETVDRENGPLWEREAAATHYSFVANRCPRTKSCGANEGDNYGKVCGDGLCCCCAVNDHVYIANCSGHRDRELRYVPSLPANITVLDFSGNKLASINSTDFFRNATNLLHLDLADNELTHIHRSAFEELPSLSHLRLTRNAHLDFARNSAAIISIRSLVTLNINDCYAGYFTSKIFYGGQLRRLRELYLSNVFLREWNATAFQVLTALQFLHLSRNDIRFISTTHLSQFRELKYLDLSMNDLFFFPRSCQYRQSIFPNLEWLDLRYNHITRLSKDRCFPKLRVLILSGNLIKSLATDAFATQGFPSMRCLSLENLKVRTIERYAFNSTTLRYLSLMYNNIDFPTIAQGDAFRGMPSLETLQLEHNYITSRKFTELFGSLTTLRYVFIGNTDMDYLTRQTFAPFRQLQSITLHRNSFSRIEDGVFDGLPDLFKVDLSNCRIGSVGPTTFSADTRRRLQHLDLSGNPFVCDCELRWFRDWLASRDAVFNRSYDTYTCRNLNDTPLVDFRIDEQVCLLSHGASEFIMGMVSFLMVILMLVAVVFRYRWHIRLMLYETFRGKSHKCGPPSDSFRYDLFVCYADEDLNWITDLLMPEMEARQGRRLCIHQRDFMPGENIVDNIFRSVQASRRVLMVFSRHFTRSQWCQFELALCLSHVVDNGDTLLVVCVDDVTSGGDMTPTMMAVMHTMTYIQWADDTRARTSFWDRFRVVLGKEQTGVASENDSHARCTLESN